MLASRVEAWWFDTTRHVETTGYIPLAGLTLVGPSEGCFEYLHSRAATARRAIRQLPIRNFRDYTFIDMGSGRGRVLFLAAEYPFRRIEGVEFATELHLQAQANIVRFRGVKQNCTRVESVNVNAVEYTFPNENVVVFFFNPFGTEVMHKVLSNLEASLDAKPREAWLVITDAQLAPTVRRHPRFQSVEESRRYCVYQAVHGSP
jgi:hypothetical protein